MLLKLHPRIAEQILAQLLGVDEPVDGHGGEPSDAEGAAAES